MLPHHLLCTAFLEEKIAMVGQRVAVYMHGQTQPPAPPTPDPPTPTAEPPVGEGDQAAAAPNTAVPWAEAVTLLDTAPGIGRTVAEMIIAEVGTDMSRFPSEAHLASWAKVSPGNHESGGKRYTGKTGKGSRWLRSALVQAAHAAVKVKDSHLAAVYHRLKARRGKKKAIIAVAHRLLVAIYHMLKQREPYREIGSAPQDPAAK